MESEKEKLEDRLEIAESIYEKLKFYVDFHGLDFLNVSPLITISDILNYVS